MKAWAYHGTLEGNRFLLQSVISLPQYLYKAYNFQVSGRIIIDTDSFNRHNPSKGSSYGDDLHKKDFAISEVSGMSFKDMVTVIHNDYTIEQEEPKITLTAEGHLICKSVVPGYSLKLKRWSAYPSNPALESSLTAYSVFLRRFCEGDRMER